MADRSKQRISPLELHAGLQDSALHPLVVDVRSQADYKTGHIPDAINIPADVVLESLDQLSGGQPLVLYCDMRHPGASRSERAAAQLRNSGIQVQVLEGGLPAWEAAEYPVDRGRQFHQIGKV